MNRRTDHQSRTPSPRFTRRHWLFTAAGVLTAGAGAAAVWWAGPQRGHAAEQDVVMAAPMNKWTGNSASQETASRVTVSVNPGEGSNVATQAVAPASPQPAPTAASTTSVEEAFKLFQETAVAPAAGDKSTITPVKSKLDSTARIEPLKSQRTSNRGTLVSANAKTKPLAKPTAKPTPVEEITPAADPVQAQPSGDQWTLTVGAFDTREAAQEAAASALYHLHNSRASDPAVKPYVAVDETAEVTQRFTALLAGFEDQAAAEQHAQLLVKYGYRSHATLVDFSSSDAR